MAGVITTGNHPKALWPGVAAWWGRSYDEHKTEYTDIYTTLTSDKKFEDDVQLTGFGLVPVKAEGASVSYDDESQGYISRYTNVAYALGYIVTREELDDVLYTEVSKRRAEALAFSFRQTKEIVGANVLNRAFTAAYAGGDGLELCSLLHVTSDGTQANELTTAADLSETALEDLVKLIMTAKNHRGMKISIMPKSLIVPPNLWLDANRILKSTLSSADMEINVLKSTGVFPEGIKFNHYLTDDDAYFVKTNAPRGMIHFERVPIEFDKDNDFDTMNAKAMAYERYSFGWTDWRGIFGSPGA